MEERCDQFQNCEDFSDEDGCKLVSLPENYIIDYVPFTVDKTGNLVKVPVRVKVVFRYVEIYYRLRYQIYNL